MASDVYALGVVLYALLAGASPYRPRSRDPLDVADAVRTTIPQRPSATTGPSARGLRGDLDTIVLAALRKEPERRYARVEDLADDLRRHLDARPIRARRDSMAYRASRFVRRNRTSVLAAGLAVLVTSLVAAGVVYLRPAGDESSLLETGVLAERDRIVVSHFSDQGGDTALAAALTDAFRIDVSQSPNVRVLSPLQVRSALERMQHAGAWITNDSVARDLAVREGAKAYVAGSLARVGGTYTLMVQLVGARAARRWRQCANRLAIRRSSSPPSAARVRHCAGGSANPCESCLPCPSWSKRRRRRCRHCASSPRDTTFSLPATAAGRSRSSSRPPGSIPRSPRRTP